MVKRREFSPTQRRERRSIASLRSKGPCLKWILAHIEKDHSDECIEWPFSKRSTGYGQVFVAGRRTSSNNLICELYRGPSPHDGWHAAHSCGNRGCCNPKHITWKSPQANIEDKITHGTQPRGSQIYSAKINEADVVEIRDRSSRGESLLSIARDFGMSPQGIWDITKRKTWRHV